MSIATLSTQLTKPSKAEAQEICREIYAEAQRMAPDDADLKNKLAKLYSHFAPPIPKKAKTPFEWVAKAIGQDDVRYYLNYVYVTERKLIGTDGHRLHVAINEDGLAPGFYLPNGDKAHGTDYANFPDWRRVMPKVKDVTRYTIPFDELDVEDRNWSPRKKVRIGAFEIQEGEEIRRIAFQMKYLQEAANGAKKMRVGVPKQGRLSVLIESEFGRAAVMPVRE